jgi:hypothetical protein
VEGSADLLKQYRNKVIDQTQKDKISIKTSDRKLAKMLQENAGFIKKKLKKETDLIAKYKAGQSQVPGSMKHYFIIMVLIAGDIQDEAEADA